MVIDSQLLTEYRDWDHRAAELLSRVKLQALQQRVQTFETQMSEPAFWSDQEKAKQVSQEAAALKQEISEYLALDLAKADVSAYMELATELADNTSGDEFQQLLQRLRMQVESLELRTYFSGKFDACSAVLSVHSGQGGTEAMDWADMLRRMYVRYFERKGWKYELADESAGEEAGIKSATYLVHAAYTYGLLRHETGTHRLVRQSPFNADNLRQTSFAGVEVLPLIEDQDNSIEINPSELDWQFTRAGGHGGQNVNKVNTAVRLTHIPSGIVVESRQERYQEQNRKIALTLLKSKLAEIELERQQTELNSVKGEHKLASFGNQIRNYVLHPYHLVKDVRTKVESTDTQAVLDGDIDLFILAESKL